MIGEKSNAIPIHKRESKNLIKNYQPISFLPISNKFFERLIVNSLSNYFVQSKLFTEFQSGFITHEIYKFQFPSYDIRGTFLDTSKTFDKVWHKGLIFELKSYGEDGNVLK